MYEGKWKMIKKNTSQEQSYEEKYKDELYLLDVKREIPHKKKQDSLKIIKYLIKIKQYNWAHCFLTMIMAYKDYVSYGVFAAEQFIDSFENEYPNNKQPREAINAAKRCIKNPSKKNKAAAYLAFLAEEGVYSAASSAAQSAAQANANVASHAAYAACFQALRYAPTDVAAYAAYPAMNLKIMKYGLKLLKDK